MAFPKLPYELIYTPKQPKPKLFEIRDEKDYPVLYSAITEDVDVFITGDRDFDGLGLKKPEIISPAGFLEKYRNREAGGSGSRTRNNRSPPRPLMPTTSKNISRPLSP
jgi:hypothetical protein